MKTTRRMSAADYGMLAETIRAYSGLDEDSLRVLQAAHPKDRIRQAAIAAVLAARAVDMVRDALRPDGADD